MKVALHTTLSLLKQNDACESGYGLLVAHLGTDWPDDKPINLLTCLESNPVADVIWALRATTKNCDVVARLMAADFAESVLHIYEAAYANDRRPRDAIEAARAFALGEINDAAWVAARAAARAAAGDAARDAARDAALAAAWDVAWAAAGDAAWDAAWDVAWVVEKNKQAEIIHKYLLSDEV